MSTCTWRHYNQGKMIGILLSFLLLAQFEIDLTTGASWTAIVKTGDENWAGTDSRLHIEIFGTEGDMGYLPLSGSFENDDTDYTYFDTSIGEPYKIRIFHDEGGTSSGWRLDWIKLRNSNREYRFPCYCWIDGESKDLVGDTKVCRDVPNCKPGYKDCGTSISDSQCRLCYEPYYSGGWGGGCKLCNPIAMCTDRFCSSGSDVKCRSCEDNNVFYKVSPDGRNCDVCPMVNKCEDQYCSIGMSSTKCRRCEHNNVFYKVSPDRTQCEKLCAWNNQYCWPGTCGDGLVKNCQCTSGFQLISTASETSCQLRSHPTIETCAMRTTGPNGEIKMSTNTGPTTQCQYQSDFYGNFQPVQHYLKVFASYVVDTSMFPPKTGYIESYNFGITDLTVNSVLSRIGVPERILQSAELLRDDSMSKNVVSAFSKETMLTVPNVVLQSGDGACICSCLSAFGWTAIVKTGDENNAGTDSSLHIDIFGTEGYMEWSTLHGSFERYDTDTTYFDISIGEPYKIHIYHDGSGNKPGWRLDWIILRNSNREYRFPCYCWIDDESRELFGDTKVCRDVPNCQPGYKDCGNSIYDSRCTRCYDPYYSGGWGGGCKLCNPIAMCTDRFCTSGSDVKCRSCEDNNVFYKVSSDARQCEELCSWNDNYCWPGTCGQGRVKHCQCTSGFELISTASETSCQLRSHPTLETCATRIIGQNGEVKMSKITGPTTACQYQSDFYGNFQPVQHYLKALASFIVYTSKFPPKAGYIESYNFGITDFTVHSVVNRIGAPDRILQTVEFLTDDSLSKNVVSTFSKETNLMVTNVSLQSGDRKIQRTNLRGAEKQTTKDMAEMLLEHRLEASCTKSMREREQFWIVVELQVVEGQVYVKINIVKMFKSNENTQFDEIEFLPDLTTDYRIICN